MKSLLIALTLLFALNLQANEAQVVEGVRFEPTMNIADQDLVLNGIGVRRATFLKVRVYVGGLYLERKSSTPSEFLAFSTPKYINMHFLRAVKKADLTSAWDEGFVAALGNDKAQTLTAERARLNDLMVDLKRDETMNFTFLNDRVLVEIQNRPAVEILGSEFSRGLLSVWFLNPRDEGLTNGLLGL
jgi:hypothetical protein